MNNHKFTVFYSFLAFVFGLIAAILADTTSLKFLPMFGCLVAFILGLLALVKTIEDYL